MHIKAMLEQEGDSVWEKSGDMLHNRNGDFLLPFLGPFLKPLCLERAHGKQSVLAGTVGVLEHSVLGPQLLL